MNDLREMVDVAAVGRLFGLLALLAPLVGAALGAGMGTKRNNVAQGAKKGLCFGLIGTANWLLWNLYNVLTDRLGLDTVLNVAVNVALFVALGLGVGYALGARSRSHGRQS
jgi:lipopolysaccharide export LptBFGC system permease protein LptF